jgi:hypothetical protein
MRTSAQGGRKTTTDVENLVEAYDSFWRPRQERPRMSFWKSLFGGSASREGSASGAAGAKTTRAKTTRSVEHIGFLIEAATRPAFLACRARVEHTRFLIEAAPFPAEGQYQVAGVISKEIGGVRKQHHFVRADRCSTPEDATEIALRKGRQIVDE